MSIVRDRRVTERADLQRLSDGFLDWKLTFVDTAMIKEADHGLTEPTWQRESTAYLVNWLKQRTAG